MSINLNVFNNLGNQIRSGFEHLPQNIAHIPQQVEQATGINPEDIRTWILHEVGDVLTHTAGDVAKGAFKTSAGLAQGIYDKLQELESERPELVDAINKVAMPISLSVVNMKYDNFYGRAEGLCRVLTEQAQKFEFNRHSIKWILENTGPTEIGVTLSGQLFTSLIAFSIGLECPLELAIELVDIALEKAGVPE